MGREQFNRKLLVEGKDDQHVIYALRDIHDMKPDFDVIDCGGITNLFEAIELRLKLPRQSIGVIIDADEDINGRWQRVSGILAEAGFAVPEKIVENGLVIVHPNRDIKFGIWIMPDNNLNGMIEDFIKFMIPKNDGLLPIAEGALTTIEQGNFHRYSAAHRSKALIHTWLSWQDEPGRPLGQSITRKYLDANLEICIKLINWFNAVLTDPDAA